jgi:hypothetical protein
MANRNMSNQIYSHERARKIVSARAVSVGGATVPTLDAANSKGVLGLARTGVGAYTFTFGFLANGLNVIDTYVRLLSVSFTLENVAALAAGSTITCVVPNTANLVSTAGTLGVVLLNLAGTAAEPLATDILKWEFNFADSNAP